VYFEGPGVLAGCALNQVAAAVAIANPLMINATLYFIVPTPPGDLSVYLYPSKDEQELNLKSPFKNSSAAKEV